MEIDALHYYLRKDDTKQPFACVAISKNEDGTVNRGISICSKDEPFKRGKARDKALGRLAKAVEKKEDSLPLRRMEIPESLSWYFYSVGKIVGATENGKKMLQFKSIFSDVPTTMEKRMLEKPAS